MIAWLAARFDLATYAPPTRNRLRPSISRCLALPLSPAIRGTAPGRFHHGRRPSDGLSTAKLAGRLLERLSMQGHILFQSRPRASTRDLTAVAYRVLTYRSYALSGRLRMPHASVADKPCSPQPSGGRRRAYSPTRGQVRFNSVRPVFRISRIRCGPLAGSVQSRCRRPRRILRACTREERRR